MTKAEATFKVTSWSEDAYDEVAEGPRLTRATVTKSFSGDIEGKSSLEYLMVYREDGTGSFVGVERVVGKLTGRSGSFVLQHVGTFDGDVASVQWTVVPGSGTGQLKGLSGSGGFASGHAESYPMTLDYSFE